MSTPDRCVLLVEDNPDDADLIAYAFRKAGIAATLRIVEDGEKAVDHLDVQSRGVV